MKAQGKEPLDYLMTYGWIVIIVVGAVGALSYFDIFDTTTIPTGAVTSFDSNGLKYGGIITIVLLSVGLYFYLRNPKK